MNELQMKEFISKTKEYHKVYRKYLEGGELDESLGRQVDKFQLELQAMTPGGLRIVK